MDAPVRPEIAREFEAPIRQLQYQGDAYRDGEVFRTFGIVYVPDPNAARLGEQKSR